MSYLSGSKALFGELFAGHYYDAKVTDQTITYATDGTMQRGPAPRDCKARVDSATQRMRESPGFAETDRAIFILAATLAGPLNIDAELEILEGDYAGSKFGIATIDRPPGASYFLCRGAKRG